MKSMGCSRTRMSAAESDHLPDLVKAAQRLPDVLDVTPDWQGVRVDFPESEFLINTKEEAACAQGCVKFSGGLQAGPPGLSTWWSACTTMCPKTRVVEMALEVIIE